MAIDWGASNWKTVGSWRQVESELKAYQPGGAEETIWLASGSVRRLCIDMFMQGQTQIDICQTVRPVGV
jgi:hypothetical protein